MKSYRKLFLLMALIVSIGINAFAYQNSAQSNTDATSNRELLWVYNSDNVAHEVGDVVVYKDSTVDGITISTTTSANDKLVAGVVAINDIPASGWGFIQTSGYHSAITVDEVTAAGSLLATSTTGESATVYDVSGTTTTTGTAATSTDLTNAFGIFAVALEATTSSTTVKGFIYRR